MILANFALEELIGLECAKNNFFFLYATSYDTHAAVCTYDDAHADLAPIISFEDKESRLYASNALEDYDEIQNSKKEVLKNENSKTDISKNETSSSVKILIKHSPGPEGVLWGEKQIK